MRIFFTFLLVSIALLMSNAAMANGDICDEMASSCTVAQLCDAATGTTNEGEKFWRLDAKFSEHVKFAKSMGIACDVPRKTFVALSKTCEQEPSKCSVVQLCEKAAGTNTRGEKFWRLDAIYQPYVIAAKEIGVNCGINTTSANLISRTSTASSDLATKKISKYKNRKALVIGNANYKNQVPLKNPINDARSLAKKLEEVGFDVTYQEDLSYREFGRTLVNFQKNLSILT